MKHLWTYALALVGLVVASGAIARTQIQYKSGQNVVPVYEGWLKNSDGTIDMIFGYLNRNWEEDLQVPVGPNNSIAGLPGAGVDHGQPTIFYHRVEGRPGGREQFVFSVRLPKEWGKTQELVWSVTAHGKTDKVIATLNPVEEVDYVVIAENRGGGIVDGNKPPSVTLTASSQTVTSVPGTVKLTAVFKDDGLPKRQPPRANLGIGATGRPNRPPRLPGVKWVYHRGPAVGAVKFSPEASPVAEGNSATLETTATFTEPGTYVLRAYAEDTPLYSIADVTVTVTGRAPTGGGR
jgi:hypothetical protein